MGPDFKDQCRRQNPALRSEDNSGGQQNGRRPDPPLASAAENSGERRAGTGPAFKDQCDGKD